MRYSKHFQQQIRRRAGISAAKFVALMRQIGVSLPNGEHTTAMGTVIVENNTLCTFLTPEMTVVRRAR